MRFPIKITENFLLEPVMHGFGVRTETSHVDLESDHLAVKMGAWFEERIPLAAIAAIAPSDWPWWGGLGVKLGHHGVAVVGSGDGIVNLKFKDKVRVHVVMNVSVEQMWLSMVDPTGFMQAVATATNLPVGPHTPF
jgi:hypothetical protein